MSRFKVKDVVYEKDTHRKGVVQSVEEVRIDKNNVRIEYVVKFGEGFENWKACSKKELYKKDPAENPSNEYYVKYLLAEDRVLTLVGIVSAAAQELLTYSSNYYYPQVFAKTKSRHLNVGYSIYNPEDEYDEGVGYRVAKKRAKTKPICTMDSCFSGEFNKETVLSILRAKADYIYKNQEKFTKGYSKYSGGTPKELQNIPNTVQ